MTSQGAKTVVGRRAAGISYLVVIALLLYLAIAIYDKKFTTVVLVKFKADHTGNALRVDSDVKERGIIVGSVHGVKVDSGPNGGCPNEQVTCVTVTAGDRPEPDQHHPGERDARRSCRRRSSVSSTSSLEIHSGATPRRPAHQQAHDVIPQDQSIQALETEKVLGDLLPLLTAVQPAQLNATLTAIATALQGRGAELGQTLVSLDTYLKKFSANKNQLTNQFISDLGKLGSVADVYNQAAPDIIATLNNLKTTSATLVSQQNSLNSLLTVGKASSDEIDGFLAANQQNLITLTDTSGKIYHLLAEYSPEFTCLVQGLAHLADRHELDREGQPVPLECRRRQHQPGRLQERQPTDPAHRLRPALLRPAV